ncbi:cupin domain-containing protein [Gorillibacterium massiliense]|uniref:cupin domain-containing protein n=1 Tax=Gorillibacterium massiliense TaxID=1280390 RepID=UPI0004AE25E0|nr:cupin domain-containing protein [Gorillibacterium massiliense]
MNKQLSPLVEQLALKPHIEGGWFREYWRTPLTIPQSALGGDYTGPRSIATAVYFLLHPGENSEWHVVRSDELWLWHSGGPLLLTMGGSGDTPTEPKEFILGMGLHDGQQPQALVPAGVWQKAEAVGDEPVLVSCVVAPGFDFDDFKLVGR